MSKSDARQAIDDLHRSPVVANCSMNRERALRGPGGYERELRFDIVAHLQTQAVNRPARWIDLCCGTGKALIEAVEACAQMQCAAEFEGIDLVGLFPRGGSTPSLTLHLMSVEAWSPAATYDLITCVHGLHYIGDKLGLIAKAVAHLSTGGVFLANLDVANIKLVDGRQTSRWMAQRLREQGLEYDSRHHLVRCDGPRHIQWPWAFTFADDNAGPNYTGQRAVDSYYRPV